MANNTKEKTQDAVDEVRNMASDALSSASERVRKGSKAASKAVRGGGDAAADGLKTASGKVHTNGHSGMRGYVSSHPGRLLLFAGLVAGVIAVLFVRRGASTNDDIDDYPGFMA